MLITERGFLVAERFSGITIKKAQGPAAANIRGQQQPSKMNDIKRPRQPLFIFPHVCVMCLHIVP
jgi:hypothetical protein